MSIIRKPSFKPSFLAICLLGAGIATLHLAAPAHASDFSAFAEDEDACRQVGTSAIGGASGPTAAQRYDFAYRVCMTDHGRRRWMRRPSDAGAPLGNPHSFEYPDAFYSVPYATPGYGYDGFSYLR